MVIHTPTGTQYGTITMKDGQYNIRNMRVGGPYTVVASFLGYQEQTQENIYLNLNKTTEVDFTLTETTLQLEEVVVTVDQDAFIDPNKTGSRTNVSSEKLELLPSIARSAKDFTRLTPESDGNSFGGRNNLYNNFSLDGSIFNNSFGLDYATPGGQADAQPVSLDAIEQIQVSLAPFDVREGGFTGAGINAVTKSGTNELKGTAYYFFRNESMIGKKVNNVTTENLDFSAKQFGISVGGPIIKDKLFFFFNAEAERKTELAHGFVADNGSNSGSNVTSVLESDLIDIKNHLFNEFGYETGKYQGYNHETYNNKFLFKLDYNLAKNHVLTVRYNMLDAYKDILPHPEAIGGRGPTSYRMPFENSSYRIFNEIHSVVAELNSIFSDKMANNFMVGYTAFRDHRDPHSKPFPVIDILDNNLNTAITMGSEMFSTNNILNQDVFQIKDNFTYYFEKHTFTAGFNFELFKFENSFNLFYYPLNTFNSVTDFLNNTSADIDFNDQVTQSQMNDYLVTYADVGQLAIYLQDEYRVSDKLNVMIGLRGDIPMYFNEIENTDAVKKVSDYNGWVDENGNVGVEVDPSKWPDSKLMWSPRLGFNYDVKGDNTIQLRGGTGIFTGRIPFVWLGNQSSNSGINPFYTFQVNATSKDFSWPQVWKSNLAADMVFGEGWNATLEGIYGKDLNAIVHRNYNMAPPTGQLTGTGDDRKIFAGFNEVNIYSSDPANAPDFLDAGTIIMDNTDEGYSYSLTGKLGKKFDFGVNADVAYTYMESKDYTSIPAEIAADAFQRNPVVGNPNDPSLSWSRYGLQHRFIASAMYKIEYGKMATSLAFFFEAGRGNRYSYTYAGDLNLDGIINNDLLYVPVDASDINFGTVAAGIGTPAADAAAQWTALDAFIEQDEYLSTRRGDYAERNGAMLPWFTTFDIRLAQDFKLDIKGKENTFQLTFDLLNAGNLIVPNWGVRQFASTYTPITVNGVDNTGVPYFQFDSNLRKSYVDDVSLRSKWQLQIGIRYMFN